MSISMETLTDALVKGGVLQTPRIISAFKAINRKDFVLTQYENEAYGDYPLPIDYGQTISQPTTVAIMLELLSPQVGEKILDIGSGSGWTTTLLANIVGERGYVCGTEIIPELADFGQQNLSKYSYPHAEIIEAEKNLGLKKKAPYDKILVSAAGTELPEELIAQLKVGGVMVIPIKDAVWKVTRTSKTETKTEEIEGFAFVPLIEKK